MENQTRPSVIATLVVRGNALAMLIVGAVKVFDLVYILNDPIFAPRADAPGALRYAVAAIAFYWGMSVLLFILSRRIGLLFALDLDGSDI